MSKKNQKQVDRFQARQGDVFVMGVESIPAKNAAVPREQDSVILAHGEVTGHAHRIPSRHAKLMRTEADARFMRASAPVALNHEEHATVKIPTGNYVVVRQVEYTPEAIRQVED